MELPVWIYFTLFKWLSTISYSESSPILGFGKPSNSKNLLLKSEIMPSNDLYKDSVNDIISNPSTMDAIIPVKSTDLTMDDNLRKQSKKRWRKRRKDKYNNPDENSHTFRYDRKGKNALVSKEFSHINGKNTTNIDGTSRKLNNDVRSVATDAEMTPSRGTLVSVLPTLSGEPSLPIDVTDIIIPLNQEVPTTAVEEKIPINDPTKSDEHQVLPNGPAMTQSQQESTQLNGKQPSSNQTKTQGAEGPTQKIQAMPTQPVDKISSGEQPVGEHILQESTQLNVQQPRNDQIITQGVAEPILTIKAIPTQLVERISSGEQPVGEHILQESTQLNVQQPRNDQMITQGVAEPIQTIKAIPTQAVESISSGEQPVGEHILQESTQLNVQQPRNDQIIAQGVAEPIQTIKAIATQPVEKISSGQQPVGEHILQESTQLNVQQTRNDQIITQGVAEPIQTIKAIATQPVEKISSGQQPVGEHILQESTQLNVQQPRNDQIIAQGVAEPIQTIKAIPTQPEERITSREQPLVENILTRPSTTQTEKEPISTETTLMQSVQESILSTPMSKEQNGESIEITSMSTQVEDESILSTPMSTDLNEELILSTPMSGDQEEEPILSTPMPIHPQLTTHIKTRLSKKQLEKQWLVNSDKESGSSSEQKEARKHKVNFQRHLDKSDSDNSDKIRRLNYNKISNSQPTGRAVNKDLSSGETKISNSQPSGRAVNKESSSGETKISNSQPSGRAVNKDLSSGETKISNSQPSGRAVNKDLSSGETKISNSQPSGRAVNKESSSGETKISNSKPSGRAVNKESSSGETKISNSQPSGRAVNKDLSSGETKNNRFIYSDDSDDIWYSDENDQSTFISRIPGTVAKQRVAFNDDVDYDFDNYINLYSSEQDDTGFKNIMFLSKLNSGKENENEQKIEIFKLNNKSGTKTDDSSYEFYSDSDDNQEGSLKINNVQNTTTQKSDDSKEDVNIRIISFKPTRTSASSELFSNNREKDTKIKRTLHSDELFSDSSSEETKKDKTISGTNKNKGGTEKVRVLTESSQSKERFSDELYSDSGSEETRKVKTTSGTKGRAEKVRVITETSQSKARFSDELYSDSSSDEAKKVKTISGTKKNKDDMEKVRVITESSQSKERHSDSSEDPQIVFTNSTKQKSDETSSSYISKDNKSSPKSKTDDLFSVETYSDSDDNSDILTTEKNSDEVYSKTSRNNKISVQNQKITDFFSDEIYSDSSSVSTTKKKTSLSKILYSDEFHSDSNENILANLKLKKASSEQFYSDELYSDSDDDNKKLKKNQLHSDNSQSKIGNKVTMKNTEATSSDEFYSASSENIGTVKTTIKGHVYQSDELYSESDEKTRKNLISKKPKTKTVSSFEYFSDSDDDWNLNKLNKGKISNDFYSDSSEDNHKVNPRNKLNTGNVLKSKTISDSSDQFVYDDESDEIITHGRKTQKNEVKKNRNLNYSSENNINPSSEEYSESVNVIKQKINKTGRTSKRKTLSWRKNDNKKDMWSAENMFDNKF